MTGTRLSARCHRCNTLYSAHTASDACPDGSGTFARRPGWRPATSFDGAEIDWLSDVLAAVEQRKPLAQLSKRAELSSVVRKVHSLKRASVRAQADRERAASQLRAPNLVKLDAAAVRDIRRRAAAGGLQRDIAARYGVSRGAISKVLNGETWAHVE